jgi:hypothetical protein
VFFLNQRTHILRRDGFLILILPIIRDISIHEVGAFVRPSLVKLGSDSATVFVPELFDIRFRVTRKVEATMSHSESMSQLWAQAPSNAAFESNPVTSNAPHENSYDVPASSTSLSGVLRAALPLASSLTSMFLASSPLGLWSSGTTQPTCATTTPNALGQDNDATKGVMDAPPDHRPTNSQVPSPSAFVGSGNSSPPRPLGSGYSEFITIPEPTSSVEPLFRPILSNDLSGPVDISRAEVPYSRDSYSVDANARLIADPPPAGVAPAGDRIAERLAALRKNKK